MPALEALIDRFLGCKTLPLGISVDSRYCHANWAMSLGGISFPLLTDFHPKGAVARGYGAYLEDGGTADRATVMIDADGIVRHASSVTPAGQRDIQELAALCEKINGEFGSGLPSIQNPPGLNTGATLYVKNNCGFSQAALIARTNLHLEDKLLIKNVSTDLGARAALQSRVSNDQSPTLIDGETIIQDSKIIIKHLAEHCAPT